MTIHLYAITWNEKAMLAFFFRHYEGWVDRFFIYDDGSTDGTLEYLRGKPNVELRSFPRSHPDSFVLSQQALQNQCWKESRGRADWVIVTAIDEHLHHPDLRNYLAVCRRRGVTCIPALGYHMLTDQFPEAHEHLARTRTIGAPDGSYNKLRIFNPDAIQETSFAVGGHGARIEGQCILPDRDEMLLLHYKDLGATYPRERNSSLGQRLGATDRARNFGYQYFYSDDEYCRVLAERRHTAVDLSDRAYFPWKDNDEPRWWRPPDTLKADLARALERERALSADLAGAQERERVLSGHLARASEGEQTLSADLAGARERERVLRRRLARASEGERALSVLAGSLRETAERHAVHIGELERRETELRQSLERMTQSRSWRYTAPFRRLLSWLKGKRAA